jgi:protoporphyrinogen oxidase
MPRQRAIIIGAGPAGLTAALELLRRTGIQPILLEATQAIGGISQTVNYKGNRMDIGGHRFFSKSDRVMQWWLDLMPLAEPASSDQFAGSSVKLHYHGQQRDLHAAPAPGSLQTGSPLSHRPSASACVAEAPDPGRVMLVRPRKSRIYFLRRFFDYPIRLSLDTLLKLGLWRSLAAALSYLRAMLFPRRHELTLEDFLINRFGRRLYRMFFESYTEKVWGVPCSRISAEWGAQRIRGLSLRGVLLHFLRNLVPGRRGRLAQKQTETSLIERFLYPRLGPGQLWEHVADLVREAGGELHLQTAATRLNMSAGRVASVEAVTHDGVPMVFPADYVFSTMPVQHLIRSLSPRAPASVREVGEGLIYRDFIAVGLLAARLAVHEKDGRPLDDNWIYIQEPGVQVGRVQIFNNWSPDLVADPSHIWIGMEYFCFEADDLWNRSDSQIVALAREEISRIGILRDQDVLDAHVVRMPKTYPAYFGTYDRFSVVREYFDRFENLFLIGRNGMHKYNNQDHSMLTAMIAVDNIVAGITDKSNLWQVNTEMEYCERK